MRTWWRRLGTLFVLAALATCGGDTDERGWAAEAEQWMQASTDLLDEQGGLAILPFYAEDATLDDRATTHPAAEWEGVQELLWYSYLGADPGDLAFELDATYLDADGYVLLAAARLSYDFSGEPPAADYVRLFPDVGPDGIRSEIGLPSVTGWRDMRWRDATVADVAETVAERWVSTRSAAVDDPSSLYAEDAAVQDSVAGVHVRGISAIRAHLALHPSTSWSVTELDHGPAVYPHGTGTRGEPDRIDGVVVVVDGDDGGGCPGRQAIWLQLDRRHQVTSERRFWSIDDARRWRDADELPDGWWTDRPMPGPGSGPHEDLETVTGTLGIGDHTVEIRNGTPTLQNLVAWAFARYDQAGLALPNVSTVVFSRYDDYCDGVLGRAFPEREGADFAGWTVIACFDDTYVCRYEGCNTYSSAAKRIVLHELAHAWTADHVTPAQRQAFVDHAPGVDAWNDPDDPWEHRGTEHAAEYIAWGLLDTPFANLEIGHPSEATRALGFQILTRHEPLQPGTT